MWFTLELQRAAARRAAKRGKPNSGVNPPRVCKDVTKMTERSKPNPGVNPPRVCKDVTKMTERSKPFPSVNPPRVRKVVTKRTKRVVGYLSSVKTRALVPWESQLERDCLLLMEVDNSVISYRVQPEFLSYSHGGQDRRYCPDIAVKYRDGTEGRIEVKYQMDADDPENQELFAVFRAIYARDGIEFRVMTERDIRREPLLANAKLLLGERDHVPSEQELLRVAEAFEVASPGTLGELEAILGLPKDHRGELLRMALRGCFDIDLLTAPLSADTRITRPLGRSVGG